MLKLSNLEKPDGSTHKKKRVGRGDSSGYGTTAGRGEKGQKTRSGAKAKPWFEGGQMPLYRKIPKRGFNNPTKVAYNVVNVKSLNRFEEGAEVDPQLLREEGIIKGKGPIKLLNDGKLTKELSIKVHATSESAKETVEDLGGEVELIN